MATDLPPVLHDPGVEAPPPRLPSHGMKRLTQAERKEQTRRRLLDAAAQVFAQRGYMGTSMDAIAEGAGYTKGAVYFHFPRKEDLLLALVKENCDQELATIEALASEPGSLEERLRRVSEFSMGDGEEQRSRSLLFFELWIQAMRDPELGRRYADFYEKVRARVANLLEGEAARIDRPLPVPSDQLASAVVGLGDGLILQRLVDPSRSGVEPFLSILHMIFDPSRG
jgi:AcrR family transcriptional regulator